MTYTHTLSSDEHNRVVAALRTLAAVKYRQSVAHNDKGLYLEGVRCDELASRLETTLVEQDGNDVSEYADEPDTEPRGSHDLSDDGDALASAGHGTDEDYGGSHGGVE